MTDNKDALRQRLEWLGEPRIGAFDSRNGYRNRSRALHKIALNLLQQLQTVEAERDGFREEAARIKVTCAGKHGHNPQILDCPMCVEEERDTLAASCAAKDARIASLAKELSDTAFISAEKGTETSKLHWKIGGLEHQLEAFQARCAALTKYADHRPTCYVNSDLQGPRSCTCGLADLLSTPSTTPAMDVKS